MAIDEHLKSYSDKQLGVLRDNAARLSQSGSAKQRADAERLMPLVEAELAERKARAPAPVRKPPVRKAKALKRSS